MSPTVPPTRRAPRDLPKPTSNIYTVMLIIAFAFITLAVVFNVMDLVGRYQTSFQEAFWPF